MFPSFPRTCDLIRRKEIEKTTQERKTTAPHLEKGKVGILNF
jgi:hypothetical protein